VPRVSPRVMTPGTGAAALGRLIVKMWRGTAFSSFVELQSFSKHILIGASTPPTGSAGLSQTPVSVLELPDSSTIDCRVHSQPRLNRAGTMCVQEATFVPSSCMHAFIHP